MRIYPDAVDLYLEDPSSNINTASSRSTYKKTLRQLDDHVRKPLEDVTERDLAAFLRPDLSPGSRAAYMTRIQGFFGWAQWRGLVTIDPSANLKRLVRDASYTKPVRSHHWLSEEQIRAVLDSRPNTVLGRRDSVVLRLGFSTGLRLNEIRELTWDRVDLPNQTISLMGKGRKLATVYITDKTLEVLEAWRDEYEKGYGELAGAPVIVPCNNQATFGIGVYGPTLVALWGKPISGRTLRAITERVSEETGIVFRPHDMRRTFAGLMHKRVGIEKTSQALRHSNLGVTERYLQRRQDAAAQAVREAALDF